MTEYGAKKIGLATSLLGLLIILIIITFTNV